MLKKAICMLGLLVIVTIFSGCFKEKKVEESFVKKDTISIEKNFKSTDIKTLSNFEGGEFIVDKVIKEDDIVCNSNLLKIVTIGDASTKIALASINGKINSGDNLFSIKNYQGKFEVISIDQPIKDMILKRVDGEKLLGDFNNNGKVDLDDFMEFAKNYGQTYNSKYDIGPATTGTGIWVEIQCKATPDSVVNINDFIIFAKNYGKAIPVEPNFDSELIKINDNICIKYKEIIKANQNNRTATIKSLIEYIKIQPNVLNVMEYSESLEIVYSNGIRSWVLIPLNLSTKTTSILKNNIESVIKRDFQPIGIGSKVFMYLPHMEFDNDLYGGSVKKILNNSNIMFDKTILECSADKPVTATIDEIITALKSKQYDVIFFQTHGGGGKILFTDEPAVTSGGIFAYTKYKEERLDINGKVRVVVNPLNGKNYYGITSEYFANTSFNFNNAIIYNSSCESMGTSGNINSSLGKVFVDRGAKAYIGFNGDTWVPVANAVSEEFFNLLVNYRPLGVAFDKAAQLAKGTVFALYQDSERNFQFKINPPLWYKVTNQTNGINLTWVGDKGILEKIDGYNIYRKNIKDSVFSLIAEQVNGVSYTDVNVSANETYEYYLRACALFPDENYKEGEKNYKEGIVSNIFTQKYEIVIDAPVNFKFIGNYSGIKRLLSGKLVWDATPGATGYCIYKTLNGESLNWSSQDWLTKINEVEKIEITGVTQLVENSIKFGKKQYYTIASFKNNEKGEKVIGNLSKPLIVTIRPDGRDIWGGLSSVVFNFYEVEGATSYKFFRCDGQERGNFFELTPMNPYKLWYNFGSGRLDDGTTNDNFLLRYKAIAYDANGNTAEGNIASTPGILNP